MTDPLSNPQPYDRCIVVRTIRSGQPRPYADTEHVVQLHFLSVPYQKYEWEPDLLYSPGAYEQEFGQQITKRVTDHVKHLVGFQRTKEEHARADFNGHFDTYLDYVTYTGDASIWEARVVTPFTD